MACTGSDLPFYCPYLCCLMAAKGDVKKSTPITGHAGPEVSRKLRLLEFLTTAQYGGRLSALRTGRLYPHGIPGTHFH